MRTNMLFYAHSLLPGVGRSLPRNCFQTLICFMFLGAFAVMGQDKVAFLYVYPNDAQPDAVYSQADLISHFNGPVKKYWNENSYGHYNPTASVFAWKLPVAKTAIVPGDFVVDMLKKVLPDGGNFKISGYNPNDYSKTIILLGVGGGDHLAFGGGFGSSDLKVNGNLYPNVGVESFTYLHPNDKLYYPNLAFGYYRPNQPFKGKKNGETIGYPELGLTSQDRTLLHEWGHGIGQETHANYWQSESEPLYGKIYWWVQKKGIWDQMENYGNPFDIMGGDPYYSLHFHSFYKDLRGWFKAEEKEVIASSKQNIRVFPLETQQKGVVKCVQYPIPAGKFTRPAPFDAKLDYSFYMEYRRPLGFDIHLKHEYLRSNTEGLLVYMTRREGDRFIDSWLLDMSPDNFVYYANNKPPEDYVADATHRIEDDHHEASLNAGKTFYDEQTGFCITNIRPQGDQGLLFDTELGKKPGVESGVYTTTLFNNQTLESASSITTYSPDRSAKLYSPDLSYYMGLENGYWVVRKSSNPSEVRKMETAGDKLSFIDGNLSLTKNGNKVWSSNVVGNTGAKLVLDNEGILRIYNDQDGVIWSWPSEQESANTVTDIDENVYKTIKIGDQLWMAENLRTTKCNDGSTRIIQAKIGEKNSSPAMYWHDNLSESKNSKVYGPLYNWATVKDCDVCPKGWRIPSQDDWNKVLRKWYDKPDEF